MSLARRLCGPIMASKQLCARALNGNCPSGNKCDKAHPIDAGEAATIYRGMSTKTLNLCELHPNCTRDDCTLLHVDIVGVSYAPSTGNISAGRRPIARVQLASAPTPMGPRSGRRGAPGRGAARDSGRERGRPVKVPQQVPQQVLQQVRPERFSGGPAGQESEGSRQLGLLHDKFDALTEAELAFEILHRTLKSQDALDKMNMVKAMKESFVTTLTDFNASLNDYLAELTRDRDVSTPKPAPAETASVDDDDAE
jgi:hypothetical protein